MDRLDEFLADLQERIFDDARAAYGEKGFDRWRNPQFQGTMDTPDGHARVTGECGDTVELFLKFDDDHVADASYTTNGCASSMICASFAAELAIGKTPDELTGITAESVLRAVGSLPEEDRHCARLAAETLQEALHAYMSRQKNRNAEESP